MHIRDQREYNDTLSNANARLQHKIIANKPYENVAKSKIWERVRYQNYNHEK
jgi:hypothetical protein